MSAPKLVEELDGVVIRIAGDSGDGMQVTGDRFTHSTAVFGNDLITLPDYPAEIRAPAGTPSGVSSFQIHFSDHPVRTPGDAPNVLVAMNPAALKVSLSELPRGATILVNSDAFDARGLERAGYPANPLTDGSLAAYRVYEIPMTSMTLEAVKEVDIAKKDAGRAKNMFALGLLSWMYHRPTESVTTWIRARFGKRPEIVQANLAALAAGYNFGETADLFASSYIVRPAHFSPGTYTTVTGNTAVAWGLMAAAERAGMALFLGSYPITPASEILHELAARKSLGVLTFQAEDEIAGIGSAVGASYGGMLGATSTSGPGLDLKTETIGLAIMLELPLVIVDVQRGGPSTGLPTKTEQSDLLQALYGRHGEAPLPVLAALSPSQSFDATIEACRIALAYRTPVILLSDAYLANGSEPWRIPRLADLPDLRRAGATQPNHDGQFWPYVRDPKTLVCEWAKPGTPALEHRIGGLEKADGSGAISYDPANHEKMVRLRAAKVAGIANDIPDAELFGDEDAEVLVLGWGSTFGAARAAAQRIGARGQKIAHVQLMYLNPLPRNLGGILARFPKILVPELNLGHLATLIRSTYLRDVTTYGKIQGKPFKASEIEARIMEMLP
ncbi:MAG: 2-oxoacid:acceptor oxidoreductase subunit alpha [Actinomycetota bacterium]